MTDVGTFRTTIGARSLEGMNLRVDAQKKQLVPAGPILAVAGDYGLNRAARVK